MTIRIATMNDLSRIVEQDRHISPEELIILISLGRVAVAEEGETFLGWMRWNLFWDNTSISTGSWDMIPSAALHPSVTPLN